MAAANVQTFTDDNFQSEVVGSSTPVVVDFWAEWCQPCKMLTPTIEELAATFKGRVKVGKLDTDANRTVSVKYGIQAIPTVLVFKDGEIQDKKIGLVKKGEFESVLTRLVG